MAPACQGVRRLQQLTKMGGHEWLSGCPAADVACLRCAVRATVPKILLDDVFTVGLPHHA